MRPLIEKIFSISDHIRYVAVYHDGILSSSIKENLEADNSTQSDRFEELIVNPAVMLLVKQRGDIDCGGAEYVLIRYGHFYQFVSPTPSGHVSVSIELEADPVKLADPILDAVYDKLPSFG